MKKQALRVGIGGPVGSGKTALTLALCQALREQIDMAVVTNDIYTAEDAQFLVRHSALAPERIIGVETGGCPHTAIREDASINLEAIDRLQRAFPANPIPLPQIAFVYSLYQFNLKCKYLRVFQNEKLLLTQAAIGPPRTGPDQAF